MPHLAVLLTLSLVAGLAGGVAIDAAASLALALVMSAAWAGAVLGYLRGHARVQLAAVMLLVAGAGWVLGAHAVDRALHSPLRVLLEGRFGGFGLDGAAMSARADEPLLIEGRLRQDASLTETGAVLRLAVTHVWINGAAERASGGVSVTVGGELQAQHLADWRAGRVVRAPVLLRRPTRYLNAGVPDQERALARRGVSLVGSTKSASLVEVRHDAAWWEELAAAARARTRRALARHVAPYDERSAAIATAILIGDRAGLTPETERRLQEAGTYHVIAISGGNIAILAGLLLAVFAAAGLRGRAAWLAVIGALVAYGLIASGGPSVLRATMMAVLYLAVRLIDQHTAAASAIALTAGTILLIDPLQIVDVGFWLTFGATVALVCAAALSSRPSGEARAPRAAAAVVIRPLAAVLIGTASVELALAPIGSLIFQRVTLAGLLLNYVALPAMTVVQIGAMAVLGADVAGLDPIARAAAPLVHVASLALTESTQLLDVAPWLTWRVPAPRIPVLVIYYAALCATVALLLRRGDRRATTGLAAIAAASFVWIVAAPDARVRAQGDGRLHVTMFDVGQGDALLVTFPNGRRLMVDTGGLPRGSFDVGDRVVGPSLRAARLLSLDYLAVTHGDADHAGGARALLRDFTPHEVWWGVPVANHAPTEALRDEAIGRRAAWRTLQRGDLLDIGGVGVRLHHPPPPDWERQRVRNNDSLVMELRYGRVAVLLTGDIDRDVERELLPFLDLPGTVVLKVAHHGSGTSSSAEFLRHVRPRVALIGVGRGNAYGHPAPYVMGRLHDAGADVFRTDLDGQIDVVTDGERVEVRTYSGRTYP